MRGKINTKKLRNDINKINDDVLINCVEIFYSVLEQSMNYLINLKMMKQLRV